MTFFATRNQAFFLALLLSLFSSPALSFSLVEFLGLDKETKRLQDELDKTRADVKYIAEKAIRAVPGERYLQLIDDLHSGDPAKAEAARNFLRSLANIDPQTTYKASVWFSFDPNKNGGKFMQDMTRVVLPHPILLQKYADDSLNLEPAQVNNWEPLNAAEIEALMTQKANDFVVGLVGQRKQAPVPGTGDNSLGIPASQVHVYDSVINSRIPIDDKTAIAQTDEKVANLKTPLIEAIKSSHAFKPPKTDAYERSKSWNPLDQHNYVVIFLSEDTFNNHDKFEIQFVIKDVKSSKATLNDRPPKKFSPADFNPAVNKPIKNKYGQTLYWTSYEVTGEALFSPDTAKEIENLLAAVKSIPK
ncbi:MULTISPECIES: hypothetical protein [unclassified Bradyrhizobium]|uniref:hypothetical protein n=1 Tax=Bradyrhizobium sp. USDA 4541 TaxID=2817704 RepID=UPI0020A60E81|nr:hypothetical protein [Bradyrhizobium sp. USDA 4541]MCP1852836.1 hypothetical protein [Bradyrhizobium sp. USDA 4541]